MFGEKKENRFVKLSIEGVKDVACMQVVVDTWTGIQYLFAESFGNAGGLTALLDGDGEPAEAVGVSAAKRSKPEKGERTMFGEKRSQGL
ncbi:MAG: DUF6440 family protein [Intestinimonas sp.]